MKKIIEWFKSSKADFFLFVIFLLLINLVSYNFYTRIDLTSAKSYSLSKASKNLVKNLEEPLSVYAFFDGNLPVSYSNVAQYVDDLLTEYEGSANKNFSVFRMDTSDSQKANLARDFGLSQVQIQEVKNNEVGFKQGYMGIVITYGDAVELLNPITSTDGFEYNLTAKISKMISTRDTLAGLPKSEKISLKLYFSDSLKNLGISGSDQVEELVREAYESVNKNALGRLSFSYINDSSEDTLEAASKYGLQVVRVQNKNGGYSNAVVGLVLEHNDSFYTLPVQIQNIIFGYAISGLDDLELSISEGLQSLFSKVTKIGYITGHGELPLISEQNSSDAAALSAENFSAIVSNNYEFEELNLEQTDIPVGMNSIVINGPSEDFSEAELYKIDQFIMRGGNVLFFVDGLVENQMAMYYGGESFNKNECNISKLLNAYGVQVEANYVLDKNCYTARNSNYGTLNYYWVPNLQKNLLAQNNVITKNLGYVLMLQNSSLDVSEALLDKDLKVTVLAKSSPESWTISENIYLNPIALSAPEEKEKLSSSNLAVLIEGKFNSAYDSSPKLSNEEENNFEGIEDSSSVGMEATLQTNSHISKSISKGKLFVVGSSQVTTGQVIDSAGTTPIAMLLMNAVDYLNGNEDLCVMRTKSLLVNTLTINNNGAAQFWKYFCEYGIVLLIALAWLIVWKMRTKRQKEINKRYNPNDTRTIK